MPESGFFDYDSVVNENIAELTSNARKGFEERICEIAYIADTVVASAVEFVRNGLSREEIFALLSEELSPLPQEKNAGADSVFETGSIVSWLEDMDKAILSELIAQKLAECGISAEEKVFLPSEETDETFTYVKNSLSDEAFDVFAQDFTDPRVAYSESFKEACFAVADGKVGYCILPLEEKGGVRIPGIYSLILKLDLKIVAVTPVFGPEGNSDTKYALVGRGFSIPERGEDNDRYLELRLDKRNDLGSVLSVAKRFLLTPYRINTMYSGEIDNAEAFYSVVLKDGGSGFVPFLIYLTVFSEGFTSVGIYENLE